MAEEKHELVHELVAPNHDDMTVLNYLLENIKGISLVAGNPLDLIPVEEEGNPLFEIDQSLLSS